MVTGQSQTDTRDWSSIIPQSYLDTVAEEEKQIEQMQLYLPPRRRNVKVGGAKITMTTIITIATMKYCMYMYHVLYSQVLHYLIAIIIIGLFLCKFIEL